MGPTHVVHEHERVENALDADPKEPNNAELALRNLRSAVRMQLLSFLDAEVTSKTLAQMQRFCASVGQAMVTLERPEALVRSRFGGGIGSIGGPYMMGQYGEVMGDEDSLAPAPAIETYGANASRGIIESAAKIGKDIVVAQAEAQRKAREPTLSELIMSYAVAKNAKLPKNMLRMMEKQITDKSTADKAAPQVLALPAAIPPDASKTQARKKRT